MGLETKLVSDVWDRNEAVAEGEVEFNGLGEGEVRIKVYVGA